MDFIGFSTLVSEMDGIKKQKNKIPILYIIGSGHSGSTLLDMLLGGHSKIVGVGEFRMFSNQKQKLENQICTCGKKILDCSFWKKVSQTIEECPTLNIKRKGLDSFLGREKYFFEDKKPASNFTNLKAEIIKKRNKNIKTIFVRYEDLTDNPRKELERILKEVGLSFEERMLNFRETEQHQFAGNRLRLKKDREIKKGLSWKENLSWFDLFLFYLIAGFLNKIYGY